MTWGVVLIRPSCHAHGNNAINIDAPQDTSVATVHTPTIMIKPSNLSVFSQNQRTKSQYPDAPSADANSRKRKNLAESPGIIDRMGIATIASKIVTALKTAARATNAIFNLTALPCRIEVTSDVA
jgi:hypothetical protein